MDLSKISKGGQIFAIGGIVYFIASFLAWYSVDAGILGEFTGNAWDLGFLWGSLWALVLIVGAVFVALPAFGVAGPKLPAIGYLGAAGVSTVFTVLKLIIGEDFADTSYGIILAVIAAGAATFGAFLMFKDAGGSLEDLKDPNKIKASFGGGQGGSTPPPPPGGSTPPPPPPPVG